MNKPPLSRNKKIFNIVLFVFACAVFYLHLKKVIPTFGTQSKKSPNQKTLELAEEYYSPTSDSSSAPKSKSSGQTSSSSSKDRISECFDSISDEFDRNCPNGECFYNNLVRNNSWLAHWMDDGWFNTDEAPKSQQRTLLGKIHYALGQAELLSGNDKVPVNAREALYTFLELSKQEPRNSFYTVIIAELYSRAGDQEQSQIFLRKSGAPEMYFNSHLKDMSQEIHLYGKNNLFEAIAGFGVFANAPVASYVKLQKFLLEHPDTARKVGLQMMNDGLTKEVKGERDWVVIEYAVGRILYNKFDGRNHYMTHKDISNSYLKTADYEKMNCQDILHSLFD